MDEPVRWVTKAEAAQELEVSLSTLDRMIRKGEVEVAREGRRVNVRMLGPEDPSDEELLLQGDHLAPPTAASSYTSKERSSTSPTGTCTATASRRGRPVNGADA